jgi:prepilin-type N-terminal cleavage/methylation domain-containing protein
MKANLKNPKGLTLIELLVAIALLGILALGMTASITWAIRLYGKESTSVSLEDQLRAVQDRMVRDLRPCLWAEAKTIGSSSYLYFSSTGTNYNQYYLYNGNTGLLYRKLEGGSIDPIAEKVITATWTVTSKSETITTSPPVTYTKYEILVGLQANYRDVTKTTTFLVTLRNYK